MRSTDHHGDEDERKRDEIGRVAHDANDASVRREGRLQERERRAEELGRGGPCLDCGEDERCQRRAVCDDPGAWARLTTQPSAGLQYPDEEQRKEDHSGDVRELASNEARVSRLQDVIIGDKQGESRPRDRVQETLTRYCGLARSGRRVHAPFRSDRSRPIRLSIIHWAPTLAG